MRLSMPTTVLTAIPARSMWCAERPQEIVDWIRDHNRRNGGSRLTNYVAIDDRVLPNEQGGEYMRGHFVQTRMATGLSAERAQEAVRSGHLPALPNPQPITDESVKQPVG